VRRRSTELQPGALPPHIVKLQEERRRKILEDAAKREADANNATNNDTNDTNTTNVPIQKKTSFLDQAASNSSTSSGEIKTNTTSSSTAPSTSTKSTLTPITFQIGFHEDQGVRFSMEDAHSIETQLDKLKAVQEMNVDNSNASLRLATHDSAFFGVYDGHGGSQAAEYCCEHLPFALVDTIVAKTKDDLNHNNNKTSSSSSTTNSDQIIIDSFVSAFQNVDTKFLKHCWDNGIPNVGTTVTTVLIHNGIIYCGNAGDSRTVLCRNGKAMNLSHDHKPTDANEEMRVRQVGGFVVMGRVMGKLAVSRAIGDSQFKRKGSRMMTEFSITGPLVVPDPDVTCTPLRPNEDQFVILACDGLWDVTTSQEAVTSVCNGLASGKSVKEVSEDLVNNALKGGSRDNVTAMVVQFVPR
jgi:serine/threonine protein phosphatase PrpC